MESPEINSQIYGQMILDNGVTWQERTVFSTNGSGETGYAHVKEWSWTLNIPYQNINSKWTIDLNIWTQTIKFLGENIGEKLYNIGFGNDFLSTLLKTQGRKHYKNRLNLILLTSKAFIHQRTL